MLGPTQYWLTIGAKRLIEEMQIPVNAMARRYELGGRGFESRCDLVFFRIISISVNLYKHLVVEF